jgi:cell division protease FtsH
VARTIDAEIRRLVDEDGERATRLLAASRGELEAVTTALLERESLTGAERAGGAGGRRLLVSAPTPS